ncbi:MAG: hypothetical protein OEU36_19150 [Gammaproteobacteria bacterium]|nr:hypothetical protein [Gammaproteobacteria bacterium]
MTVELNAGNSGGSKDNGQPDFDSLSLEELLPRYRDSLDELSDPDRVLATLCIRDCIAKKHANSTSVAPTVTKNLTAYDEILQQKSDVIARVAGSDISSWRDTLNVGRTAWWWFPEELPHRQKSGVDRLLTILAAFCAVGFLSAMAEIATRFLKGGTSTAVFSLLSVQAFLTVAAGTSFTETGKSLLASALRRLGASSRNYYRHQFAAVVILLFVGFLVLNQGFPWYAKRLEKQAVTASVNVAINKLERATGLDPQNAAAWIALGGRYEEVGRRDAAAKAYSTAITVEPTFWRAHINTGRLYIYSADYSSALRTLNNAIDYAITSDQEKPAADDLAELRRNRGWARMLLARSRTAESDFRTVIQDCPEDPLAHCLLGEVLKRSDNVRSLEEYKICRCLWGQDSDGATQCWENSTDPLYEKVSQCLVKSGNIADRYPLDPLLDNAAEEAIYDAHVSEAKDEGSVLW